VTHSHVQLYAITITKRLMRYVGIFVTDPNSGTFMFDPNDLKDLPTGRYRAIGEMLLNDRTIVIDTEIVIGET
jgi:hypothetical protein